MTYNHMSKSEAESRRKAQHRQYLKRVALGIQRKSTFSGTMCLSQKWRLTKEYKNWKFLVLERDNHMCTCGCGKKVNLQVHHIKSASKYPELRYDISNGKTLYVECHKAIKE